MPLPLKEERPIEHQPKNASHRQARILLWLVHYWRFLVSAFFNGRLIGSHIL